MLRVSTLIGWNEGGGGGSSAGLSRGSACRVSRQEVREISRAFAARLEGSVHSREAASHGLPRRWHVHGTNAVVLAARLLFKASRLSQGLPFFNFLKETTCSQIESTECFEQTARLLCLMCELALHRSMGSAVVLLPIFQLPAR